MCGITGYFNFGSANGPLPDLNRMTRLLAHRGPDAEGVFEDDGIGLGHRRLSIIDLTDTGRQPMSDDSRTVWVSFNGEIYNFRELREELAKLGHKFNSRSDTEVLVHGYEQWGDSLPERLRGMFAFAVWDAKKRTLFLARDHFGIKPLYYTIVGNVFVFASEIKSILAYPEVSKEMDPEAMNSFLSFLYVPEPQTIFRAVKALPAAHSLKLADGGPPHINRYWSFGDIQIQDASDSDRISEIRAEFEDSVRAMLVSDVPVGVFLSGGLDSTGILAMMAKNTTETIQTFSVGFGEREKSWNELDAARSIAARFGANHREIRIRPDIVALLPKIIRHFDQPFANPTALILYLLSEETGRHVKVVLAGTGGDEIFAGYPRYQGMLYFQTWRRLPMWMKSGAAIAAKRFLRDKADGRPWRQRIRRFAEAGISPFDECYLKLVTYIDAAFKKSLFTSDFEKRLGPADETAFLRQFLGSGTGGRQLESLMNADINTYLPFNQLAYSDRMSMAHSLEVRVPFIDQKLIETAGKIPLRQKLSGHVTKGLFRKAMKPFLPMDIIDAPKRGLILPISLWFRSDLRDWLSSLLSESELTKRGYFRPDTVRTIFHEHVSGKRDHSHFLYGLAVLEIWHREYMDK